MEYIVISDDDLESVVEQVNDKLEEGWKLQGGISIAYGREQGSTSQLYAQALIKESK